jgi:amidase
MTTTQIAHAFADDALGDHDATALAALIRQGSLSAAEVAAAAVARAQHVNPQLNAIVHADFERVLAATWQQRGGVFAGVPTFVKDNTEVQGLPTSQGSSAVKPRPARAHGAFARQFLAQGLVCLGKSSLPEFGFNASTEFMDREPTRNPWHTDYSAGASSGGSAALVAAGVVPLAHANDGGGSIRIPAAACGLVGLKPTRGRHIVAEQVRYLPLNIVSEGVVTRSVRDTANFMAGMEYYWRNPKLKPVGQVNGPATRRLRIGFVQDSCNGQSDDDTRTALLATAQRLENLGHYVEEIPLPFTRRFVDDFVHYWGMLSWLLITFGRHALGPGFDTRRLDTLSRGLAAQFRRHALQTPRVMQRLRRVTQEYPRLFDNYDLILSPVLTHTTPPLGYLSPKQDYDTVMERMTRYVGYTPFNNVTGSPAIALPAGLSRDGLPLSVHFSAAPGDERTLLELAFELEEAQPWPRIQAAAQQLIPASAEPSANSETPATQDA